MRQHSSLLLRNILQMILPATPLFQLRDKEGAREGPKMNLQFTYNKGGSTKILTVLCFV